MFSKITDKIETYIENRVELVKLDMEERFSKTIVRLAQLIVLMMVVGMFALFLNIGIAMLLNKWLESRYWGFLIVAGVYLLLSILLYIFRDHPVFKSFNVFDKIKKSANGEQ